MKFNYKYYEDGPEAMYGLNKNLKAYCCENEVKITLTSSERRSSELIIQKMPNAREDIDIADCFMEFLLFLNKENREFYTIDKIKFIRFLNMTIKPEFINIILSLCSISYKDYYKDKCVEFGTCFIPKELKLGSLPCKGASIVISNCIIEDFQSLNGFNGDYLSIFNSNIEKYTGSVNMNCSKVNICDTPMNYPYFFLNTVLPNIKELTIDKDEEFDETDLFFIINFPNLYQVTLPAVLEDTYCLDQLRNLAYAYGVWQKDPLTKKKKVYFGSRLKILASKHPEFYVEDDEFNLWNQRINDKSLGDDDIRIHLEDDKKNRLKPIEEAYEAQQGRVEPFDFKFLSDIGALRVMNTALPFDPYDEGITCYVLDGLYTPRCRTSRVQYDAGIISLTRYLDNDSIFTSIENDGLKIIDTREDFTIEGSIIGHDVEQVRKTITSLNLRDKREISPTYEMKRLKRLVKASRNHL